MIQLIMNSNDNTGTQERSSFLKGISQMVSLFIIGLYGFVIGTVGGLTTYLFVLHECGWSQPILRSDIVVILLGAIFGGLPFGVSGMYWANEKFVNSKARR